MTNVEENLATSRLCEQYSKKVKRLCVALNRLKEIQKNSVHLCVKTNPTSSDDNYSTLPKGIFYPNAYTLRL